jgi:hypothetical protein
MILETWTEKTAGPRCIKEGNILYLAGRSGPGIVAKKTAKRNGGYRIGWKCRWLLLLGRERERGTTRDKTFCLRLFPSSAPCVLTSSCKYYIKYGRTVQSISSSSSSSSSSCSCSCPFCVGGWCLAGEIISILPSHLAWSRFRPK